ncbi:MAG TPA: hypothetical protein VHF27_00410 [Acidimicrobiales bacterium]|nr:hypothetical protein [Acidimicrobiales bacterium]
MAPTSDFWGAIAELVATSEVVVERPRGSRHPRHPAVVYPLDYGYLVGTRGGDGDAVDAFIGTAGDGRVRALACTVDLLKRDVEVKLLLGCTDEEVAVAVEFLGAGMGVLLVAPRR